jgi:heptosyltransferase II
MTSQAVLMPNWIGDLLLALSVVERKKLAEQCDISLIVPERLTGLTKKLSPLPIIPYRRSSRSGYFASVRSIQRFSKLYVLPHSFSSALFGFLGRIPCRRGISAELRGLLLTERLPASTAARTRHLTHEYSEVLETPFVNPAEWKGRTAGHSKEHAGVIVLCPGAAYGPAKQWPYFDRLAAFFPDKKFVILGDRGDAEACGGKITESAPQRTTNLAGTTSLEQAVSIIAAASVVVSNDSGLLHLAGFLGTPAVGIYGSTSWVWTRPLGAAVRIASGSCPRSPCYERTCPLDHYNCLRNTTPETVARLAKEIIR